MSYDQQYHGANNTMNRWDESRRSREAVRQELGRTLMGRPPPSFQRDVNANSSLLPPLYAADIDLEKAVFHISSSRWTDQNVSVGELSTTSTKSFPSKSRLVQQSYNQLPKRHVRIIRHFRYDIFTVYRRLFTFVVVLNGIGLIILYRQHHYNPAEVINLDNLAILASSNLLVALLVRQDFFIALLFRTAWLVPWYVPLSIRKVVTRLYCYGGIHSGAAVAGTVWWLLFTVIMSYETDWEELDTSVILVVTWMILLVLISITLFSLPTLRSRYHNTFEATHRFLGWLSIALFWAQLVLLMHSSSLAQQISFSSLLIRSPTFWNLLLLTVLLVYPWLHLRRKAFTATPLSTHALLLTLPEPLHKFSCLTLSSSPLREWHPFATFPSTDPSNPGTSMIVSDAGDWTSNLIQQIRSPSHAHNPNITPLSSPPHFPTGEEPRTTAKQTIHLYTKSHPRPGVLSLTTLYPRIIILTTGSGIGPCLSSLLHRPPSQSIRLIWSCRSPLITYGSHILSLVHRADPDARIVDTAAGGLGRPDLLQVVLGVQREMEAEAVFVLGNRGVVSRVVGGLEARGILAFGPVWDS